MQRFSLTAQHLKIFLSSFIIVFVVVLLQNLGIRIPAFHQPVPESVSLFKEIRLKLSETKNIFVLKKHNGLIERTFASGAYEEATAYGLVDLKSGEVMAEKNLSTQLPIASLTKIMTTLVAIDLATPDTVFTISPHAASQIPTKIGIVPSQKMTLDELLHAVMLTSANDAAEAVKEGIDELYDEKVFIRAMNEKASFLGLKKTHFENAQGFDSRQHFSSVEDLAILTAYAMQQYPYFTELVKKEYAFLDKNENHKQFDLYNWNGLIGIYPGANGVKIGNTDNAGRTTIVTATRGNKTIMAVVLGAPGIIERDMWAAELLDLGFATSLGLSPVGITEDLLRAKYATWKYGK